MLATVCDPRLLKHTTFMSNRKKLGTTRACSTQCAASPPPTQIISLTRPLDSWLEHVNFGTLFNCLTDEEVLVVFAAAVLERRIIFIADELGYEGGGGGTSLWELARKRRERERVME